MTTPTSSLSTTLVDNNQYYVSKYGRIAILTGDNYAAFSSTCRTALVVAGAWNIVDGTEPRPGGAAGRTWDELNRKAIQLISSSVAGPLQSRIEAAIKEEDPGTMWTELGKEDRSSSRLHQNTLFSQFHKAIWDPAAESIRTFHARLEDIRAQLAGTERAIPETEVTWRIITAIPEEPEWRQARHLCLLNNLGTSEVIETLQSYQEPLNQPNPVPATTAALSSTDKESSGGRDPQRGGRGRGRGSRGRGRQSRGGGRGRGKVGKSSGSERLCWFCGKPGHRQLDCSAYKRSKDALKAEPEHVNIISHFDQSEPDSTLYPELEHALVTNSNGNWVVDSGATRHFSGYIQDFTPSLKRWLVPKAVRLANGSIFEALGYGDINLITTKGPYTLKDVWYTPEFTCRLISTYILNSCGIRVILEDHRLYAEFKDSGITVFEGTCQQGLCYIDQPISMALTANSAASRNVLPATQSSRELWHNRLGHANYRTIDKMPEHADGISFKRPTSAELLAGNTACEACLAGRQKESFNKKTDNRATAKLRRLHCDISGIQDISIRGYRYYLLVVDDATRSVWIRFLKDKSAQECVPAFKQLALELELDTGVKISTVRADNGKGEFGADFQAFLRDKGVIFEPSPANKHSLNGVVERMMQTIKNIARSMQYAADTPASLWCYATEYAVYLKNRLISAALPWGDYMGCITPYEAYTGRKPKLDTLRIWGCAAYPLNASERRARSNDPRTRGEHIFIGIKGNKIWRFLNMETLKEEVSADVDFHEYIFPILAKDANGWPIPRKPVSITQPEHTADASKTDLKSQGATRQVLANGRSDIEDIDAQPPNKRARQSSDLTRERPVRSNTTAAPEERRGEKALEPVLGSGEEDPTPGGSGRAVETPDLPGRGDLPAPPMAVKKHPARLEEPIFKPTRSGRIPRKTVFSDSVVRLAAQLEAVHIEGDSSSLETPAAPFEAISIEEAMKEDAPEWKKAILSELESLKSTNTFSIVPIPLNRRVIRSRWVLRKKYTDGVLSRRKARLVIKGFEQEYGLDYFDTFASVARFSTLRALLAKAAAEDLEIDHLDVDTAFLNPVLKEEVYMELPEHFELLYPDLKSDGICLRLLKSLYGLKQAPRSWFQEVCDYFLSIGFRPAEADPNLFIRNGVYGMLFILLYVDDMLTIGRRGDVDAVKAEIAGKWKSKNLGAATTFVGFQIVRDRPARTIHIHQGAYSTKLLDRFKLSNSNPVHLPIPAYTVMKLSADTPLTGEYQPLQPAEVTAYRQAVGSLLYLSNCTRLDLCYAVGQLARHMQDPRICHLRLVKQVLRYLNGTRNLGIRYQPETRPSERSQYTLYSDSTWGSESDRVSFQGWVVTRSGGAISWVSQRQKSTAQSSMEAEFMAASEASREAAWLEKLNRDLDDPLVPPTLYSDNQSAVDLIRDPKYHARAKHIDIRYAFIRNDMVAKERLYIEHIPGVNQPADILTKQLPVDATSRHLKTLGMTDAALSARANS
jgi:hypothetical protein